MNPLTNIKNIQKLNETELQLGVVGKKSWHDEYKDSAWIFIGGLPYDLTEGDIVCVFSQYGEIVNINLVRDHKTGKSKGFAFLCYEDQRSTVLSVDNLNSIKILGRTIRVDHVKEYKVPKEHKEDDELVLKMRKEGCAPKISESEDEHVPSSDETKDSSKKKRKKEKKAKKEKRRDQASTSSSHEDRKPLSRSEDWKGDSHGRSDRERIERVEEEKIDTDWARTTRVKEENRDLDHFRGERYENWRETENGGYRDREDEYLHNRNRDRDRYMDNEMTGSERDDERRRSRDSRNTGRYNDNTRDKRVQGHKRNGSRERETYKHKGRERVNSRERDSRRYDERNHRDRDRKYSYKYSDDKRRRDRSRSR